MAQCTGTAKSSGKQCTLPAILGGTVCWKHGGKAPQVRNAANRRLAAADLQQRLTTGVDQLVAELEMDAAGRGPTTILLDCVYRAYAMVQLLGAVVGGLGIPANRAPGVEGTDLYGHDHLGDGRPHVAVVMYETWLDRATRAAKLALDAGVSERLVQIEQDKGRMIAQLIEAVIDDPELGLTEAQRALGRRAAAGQLRALQAG